MILFTYGSLMFPAVWNRVAGAACNSRPATLDGYAAWNVRGETYPGLAPADSQTTVGVLYLDVSPDAAARLDAFEGEFYERRLVNVRLDDGTHCQAFAYVVSPAHRDTLEATRWDADAFHRHHLDDFIGPKPAP